jgi:ribosome-binding protein aMBF1 (putative translation factor)
MATVFQCDRCARVDQDKAGTVKLPPEQFEVCDSCADELARWMRQKPKRKKQGGPR